ncbi:signal peptidase I [Neobacillus sp. DY30]|uniref:signal peptidase I n=1 Tax=Neobacillus sp. DY30 TaxID=3047871 RepID=UPI0024BFD245|nr:signal peptidase I [Neobacillus sp. DY30]WHY01364.1 signal peptidase I [Neobacillus sp. DY30]
MEKKIKKELFSWAKSIGFALIIVFICRQFIFVPVTVKGESMIPTLENNNRIVVSKTSSIQRFDLIVFHAPDADKQYVKRVIGVPGDSIKMKDDILYVNGEPYKETYVNREIKSNKITEDFTLHDIAGLSKVPKGHLFILGDNRLRSKDSREFGLILEDSVVGEVKFRFYPFNEIDVTN